MNTTAPTHAPSRNCNRQKIEIVKSSAQEKCACDCESFCIQPFCKKCAPLHTRMNKLTILSNRAICIFSQQPSTNLTAAQQIWSIVIAKTNWINKFLHNYYYYSYLFLHTASAFVSKFFVPQLNASLSELFAIHCKFPVRIFFAWSIERHQKESKITPFIII